MSNEKYLGAVEFLNAVASIRKKIEMAPSFEQAMPCCADVSYVDEKSVIIPATIMIDIYTIKNQPGPFYYIELDAKLNDYAVKSRLKTGTKDEIMHWLDQCTSYDEIEKSLFSLYRGAWESWDSVRYRDY
jgi:hypothetical protein